LEFFRRLESALSFKIPRAASIYELLWWCPCEIV
jgi:hypothetical protein